LLGDSAHSEAFAQGICGVLAGGEFRIEKLANPEYAAEGMTGQLRKLYGSRLIFIGDDRDHVLLDLAIGQLNARVLCSGHHRDGEAGSLHHLCPTSPRWSAASAFSDDLTASGQGFLVRDELTAGERRCSGAAGALSSWSYLLGRRLAAMASGRHLPASDVEAKGFVRPHTSAAVATLIADI
jgi:hypothetical protein